MNDIDDICSTILSHPRDMFESKLSTLVGSKISSHVLRNYQFDRSSSMLTLNLVSVSGEDVVFKGYVRRDEMDLPLSTLSKHLASRVDRALHKAAA